MVTDLMNIDARLVTRADIIYIRNAYKTLLDKDVVTIAKLTPALSRKHRGDFYGLLDNMGIPPIIWSTVLELNGLKSTNDFDGSALTIKTISAIEAEALLPR